MHRIIRGGFKSHYFVYKPQHFCSCPKPGPEFQNLYALVFFMFNVLRWEVNVHFVDIGGIVDHHCLYSICYHCYFKRSYKNVTGVLFYLSYKMYLVLFLNFRQLNAIVPIAYNRNKTNNALYLWNPNKVKKICSWSHDLTSIRYHCWIWSLSHGPISLIAINLKLVESLNYYKLLLSLSCQFDILFSNFNPGYPPMTKCTMKTCRYVIVSVFKHIQYMQWTTLKRTLTTHNSL